jgi:hypothetical protein
LSPPPPAAPPVPPPPRPSVPTPHPPPVRPIPPRPSSPVRPHPPPPPPPAPMYCGCFPYFFIYSLLGSFFIFLTISFAVLHHIDENPLLEDVKSWACVYYVICILSFLTCYILRAYPPDIDNSYINTLMGLVFLLSTMLFCQTINTLIIWNNSIAFLVQKSTQNCVTFDTLGSNIALLQFFCIIEKVLASSIFYLFLISEKRGIFVYANYIAMEEKIIPLPSIEHGLIEDY